MVYHLNRHFDRSKPNYSEHLLILTRMLPVLLSIGKPTRLSNLTRSRQDDNKKNEKIRKLRFINPRFKTEILGTAH